MGNYIATYNVFNFRQNSFQPCTPLMLTFVKDDKKMFFRFMPNDNNLLDPEILESRGTQDKVEFLGKRGITVMLNDGIILASKTKR